MKEMVGGCCVCSDERGWDENPLVYCDGQACNVAVHQACYGIVSVPSGPWFCRKCESQERTARVHCELCPSGGGALKKTDTNGWAHVVCALYIPEVRFGNVTTMEPIQTSLIPEDRFKKTCYICENEDPKKATEGACMSCNKAGCKQSFHVTCAQLKGLLCEEAGNLMDNVKYCGYCRSHYSKLKKTSNMKIIPPYKPVGSNLSESPGSSPEKGNQKGHTPAITQGDGVMSISSSSSNNSNCSSGGKKLGLTGAASNGKLNHVGSGHQSSTNSNQHSPVSRVPLQTPNMFSSGAFSASLGNGSSKADDPSKPEKLKLKMHPEDNPSSNSKGANDDGSFNKSDSHGKPNGSSFSLKNKDFSNLSVTDVVAATLDRPLTSSAIGSSSSSKFDISSSMSGNSTGDSTSHNNPSSNPSSGSGSTSGNRAIDKPPPDIKPHVTLTPIPPIRSSASSTASVDERERHDSRSSKSPAHHFPSSFGQSSSKVQSQISPDINRDSSSRNDVDFDDKSPNKRLRVSGDFGSDTDSASETWQERENGDDFDAAQSSKASQHLSRKERYILMGQQQEKQSPVNKGMNMEQWNRERERNHTSKSPTVSLERMRLQEVDASPLKLFGSDFSAKRGPGRPVKRNSANSRDDDSRDRKAPSKARGRRGGGPSNSFSRRDVVNGGTPPRHEENSLDEVHDSGGSRGGRHSGPPRKTNPLPSSSGPPKRPNYDDIPSPTLSQLKAQVNANSSEKVPTLAPHMFGNVLNTNSSMANRLVDTLSQEMEAAGVSDSTPSQSKLVGIPFPGKSPANNGSAIASNGNTSTARANATAPPQTLEELLERQWEQGSQFLMEQAEHLDIAQLLSCLNQLKQDNRALEDHVASLIQRKEHLSAINARLQIPLNNAGTLGASYGNSSGHGTPPMSSLPVSNKGLTGRGPSPQQQLQQQIQQEALMHQGRIPTHPFPGSESEKNSHGQSANQMHNHMNSHGPRRDMPHSGAPSSGHYGYAPSGGLPVPVVTSHPSSHHPPIRRDRD